MQRKHQFVSIIGFLILSFALLYKPVVYASEIPLAAPTVVTPTPTPTPVDYTMPYPGLLADNPLYKLKTFRDRLVSTLISDPGKKARFDILQSDKRFAGAQMLFALRPSEQQLVLDTISKANNYMEEAIVSIRSAKSQGMHYADSASVALKSNAKHQEILQTLGQTMGQSATLQHESERMVKFIDTLHHILPQQ